MARFSYAFRLLRYAGGRGQGEKASRREATLRPLARALSFVILRPSSISSADPSRQSRSPSPRLTRLIPGVLWVSIFTTLRRSDWHERAERTKWKGNDDNRRAKWRLRSENFFFYVFSVSIHLALSSSFFFSHAKTPRADLSSENDIKRTGRRGFGGPSGRIAACTRNVLRVADPGITGGMTWTGLLVRAVNKCTLTREERQAGLVLDISRAMVVNPCKL